MSNKKLYSDARLNDTPKAFPTGEYSELTYSDKKKVTEFREKISNKNKSKKHLQE